MSKTNQKIGLKREHWSVLFRNVRDYEAQWAVIKEGSGAPVDMRALFFRQEDAVEYVQWKNERITNGKKEIQHSERN